MIFSPKDSVHSNQSLVKQHKSLIVERIFLQTVYTPPLCCKITQVFDIDCCRINPFALTALAIIEDARSPCQTILTHVIDSVFVSVFIFREGALSLAKGTTSHVREIGSNLYSAWVDVFAVGT